MSIVTNYKFNFTRAENDTFLWVSGWNTIVHKPSGRSIYQMHWLANGKQSEQVEPDVSAELISFLTELRALQQQPQGVEMSDEDAQAILDDQSLMARMDDPNSDL